VVRNVAAVVRKEGSNIWYSEPLEAFLPAKMECPDCGSKDLRKNTTFWMCGLIAA